MQRCKVQRCRDAEMQRCIGAGVVQSCRRGAEVKMKRCRDSRGAKVQRCRDAEVCLCVGALVQRCIGALVQRCRCLERIRGLEEV